MTMMDDESFAVDAHNNNGPDISSHHTNEPEQRTDKHMSDGNGNGRMFGVPKILLLIH